jgi:hypothetical protein
LFGLLHRTQQLESLQQSHEETRLKMENPDTSSEEKRQLSSQLDLIKRKMSSMQAQLADMSKVHIPFAAAYVFFLYPKNADILYFACIVRSIIMNERDDATGT